MNLTKAATRSIGAPFSPILDDLEANALEYFGTSPVRLTLAAALDRPFSHVLRVRVDGESGQRSHVFVKVFKPRLVAGGAEILRARVVRDFETTLAIHEAMSGSKQFGAVRPVACYPEHLTIVTEEVAGPTLLHLLLREGTWFPPVETMRRLLDTMGMLGQWIRTFQAIPDQEGFVAAADLVEYIDVRLRRLVSHPGSPIDEGRRQRVLAHIRALCQEVPSDEFRRVRVHSDLALENILVPPGRIVVLDFAMADSGTRVQDLTRVFVQLDLLHIKPYVRRSTIRELQQALIAGFDTALSEQAPVFRLLVLLHRINHLTTASVRPARLPERLYNRFVRAQHLHWLDAEVARGPAGRA